MQALLARPCYNKEHCCVVAVFGLGMQPHQQECVIMQIGTVQAAIFWWVVP